MKKTISIFSIFLAALVGFTYELTTPITADTYTPQVEKVEVSATNASSYTLDYPVSLRQVRQNNGIYTYSNSNTINGDFDLPALANLYYHKDASGPSRLAYPQSDIKYDGPLVNGTNFTPSQYLFTSVEFKLLPGVEYTYKHSRVYSGGTAQGGWTSVYYRLEGLDSLGTVVYSLETIGGGDYAPEESRTGTFTLPSNVVKCRWYFKSYDGNTNLGIAVNETTRIWETANSFVGDIWADGIYEMGILSDTYYTEFTLDGTTWTQMSNTSTSIQEYYSLLNVVDSGSQMSLDEISYNVTELTDENEEYYLLLTFNNMDATTFGDITVDGSVIKHETDLISGYIVNDEKTEIAIPFRNPLTVDGTITHTVDSIQVLNDGIWDNWAINQSHSLPVQLPIEQTAYYTNAAFDKSSVSFGDNYNLIIDVVNPDLYDIHSVTVNGIQFTYPATMSVNAERNQITIPYTAQVVYGDNIHTINSIEFMENSDPWDSYIQTVGISKSIISNLTFTNDITITGINIPGTSYLGDIPELQITLNNPEQLPVNYVNISGIEYTVFQLDPTNSVITIDWPVGIVEGEFNYEVQHINFTKNIDGSVYQSSKLIQSPFTYDVLNPIDLANIRVKNFRSEELKAVVDSEFDLTLSIDNPTGYDIHSVSINGISRTDIITNDSNTIITIPVTAMDAEGRQVFVLDGIRFAHFNNIQTYRSYLVDDVVITVPIESYQFTREVNVTSIDLVDESVYVGDETSLLITLDNPNGYEITELSINGTSYQATQFDINDTNTVITIPTKIGDTEEVVFNLDSISIKRFTEIGTRTFESITSFTVGSLYEKEVFLANNVWWAVFLYTTLAPKIDWLIMDTWGQITLGVILVAILGGIVAYVFSRDKEDKK